jgi:hypothetical protein
MPPARLRRALFSRIVLLMMVIALGLVLNQVPARAQARSANPAGGGRQIAYMRPPREIGYRRSGHSYRPLGAGNLQWHGGPVQHHPTQYLIFWGPTWATSSNSLVSTGQLVKQYFTDMAGTAFERIVTQYRDNGGPIANTDTVAAEVVDTSAPPTDSSCGSHTIQDADIMKEIAHAGLKLGWPAPSVEATYFVFTPPQYAINDGTGNCSTTLFCAYHAWSTITPAFAYSAIPYPADSSCEVPRSPHHDLVGDSLVSISSHEQLEAMTDPQVGSGWMDADSFELADKCATDYPAGNTLLSHGGRYELQAEYSNASRSCATSYSPPPPPHHPRPRRR